MEWVAPMYNEYPNAVKFVPVPLATDKTIKNGKSHYANLLKEQNYYLDQYKCFQIGGYAQCKSGKSNSERLVS
eukprot:12104569-Ditylum_brightwellii.AAC.1